MVVSHGFDWNIKQQNCFQKFWTQVPLYGHTLHVHFEEN